MKRILITGGSGFIGTNLVEFYLHQSDTVVLNIDSYAPRNTEHISCWQKANIIDDDQENLKTIISTFDPQYIFHLAARTDLEGKDISSYQINTIGVENLIRACIGLKNLKRIAFASSRLVCEIGYQPQHDEDYLPTTIYGESKVLGERIVKSQMRDIAEWFIFRPTSIWGAWFGVPYLNFFLMVNKRVYFHPRGKAIYKSFGYVENSVYQLDKLMFAAPEMINKKMFYLCDYPPLELMHWGEMIAQSMKLSKPRIVPLVLLRIAAKLGDLLKVLGLKNPPLTSFRLDNLLTEMTYNTEELKKICGDLPYSLETGVEKTVSWLKSHHYIDNKK